MSGAAILLIAAAAKQKRDREMAAARKRRRANEEARKARNSRSGSYGSRSSYGYSSSREHYEKSYIECVMTELEYGDDEQLLEFAKKFNEQCKKVSLNKGQQFVEEAEKCMDHLNELNKKRNEVIKEIEESGVSISHRNWYYGEYHVVELADFCYRDARGDRVSALKRHDSNNTTTSIPKCFIFKGLYLNREMLTDPNDATFKIRYEEIAERNKDLRSERETLIEEIQRKEKRLKFAIFGRDDKEYEIDELRRRGEEIDKKLAEEERARVEYETFKNLTPEQKAKIVEYMDLSDAMISTKEMIRKYSMEFKKVMERGYDRETVEQALEQMIESEGLTEEDISAIFRKMDRIAIRRNRGEYQDYCADRTRKFPTYSEEPEEIKKAMKGFIEYVYEEDEKFVENNREDAVMDQEDEHDGY